MHCKNCNTVLTSESNFCNTCGGKVIRNRLTIGNLFEHISETFFNYDNKLLRTFIDLFKKPEVVIGSYVYGVRKRYVNPLSYLGISLTLSGIIIFILKKVSLKIDFDVFNQGMTDSYLAKIQSLTTDYASVFFVSYIPMLVISSWLILKTQKYNLTERTVAFTYTMAQFSIASFIPSLLILIFRPSFYMNFSYVASALLIFFTLWVLFRISKLKGIELLGQFMAFFFFMGILFSVFILALGILLFFTGMFNLQDFAPPS